MQFRRYTANEITAGRYYQLPKFLFEGRFKAGLSAEAKLLYSLLKDRFEMSLRSGWVNSNGEVYLIYTRQDMCDMLGCKMQKIRKLIDELKTCGLLDEERPGRNLPNRIYLTCTDFTTPDGSDKTHTSKTGRQKSDADVKSPSVVPAAAQPDGINSPSGRINSGLSKIDTPSEFSKKGLSKFNTPDCRKSTPIKTNNNKYIYNLSYLSSISKDECNNKTRAREDMTRQIKENISYDVLAADRDIDTGKLDELTEIIIDALCSDAETIRVGRENRPAERVKSMLLRLEDVHIRYVLNSLTCRSHRIRNIKAYLLTALYNAPLTIKLWQPSGSKTKSKEKSYDIDEIERLVAAQYTKAV